MPIKTVNKDVESLSFDSSDLLHYIDDIYNQEIRSEHIIPKDDKEITTSILQDGRHVETVFLYKKGELLYYIPCNAKGTEICDSLQDNGKISADAIVVTNTAKWLQKDGHSCLLSARKVRKFADKHPEKVKDFISFVDSHHQIVVSMLEDWLKDNSKEYPDIRMNNYFEGYLKNTQTLSKLSPEKHGSTVRKYLVKISQGMYKISI